MSICARTYTEKWLKVKKKSLLHWVSQDSPLKLSWSNFWSLISAHILSTAHTRELKNVQFRSSNTNRRQQMPPLRNNKKTRRSSKLPWPCRQSTTQRCPWSPSGCGSWVRRLVFCSHSSTSSSGTAGSRSRLLPFPPRSLWFPSATSWRRRSRGGCSSRGKSGNSALTAGGSTWRSTCWSRSLRTRERRILTRFILLPRWRYFTGRGWVFGCRWGWFWRRRCWASDGPGFSGGTWWSPLPCGGHKISFRSLCSGAGRPTPL